jgi:hypothetical protein
MRQILMTILLIVTVVSLYSSLVQGNGGTKEQIQHSGTAMADEISRISP